MKKFNELPLNLKKMETTLGGVFQRHDLAHLFSTQKKPTLSKRIQSLIIGGHLKRALQGYYYTPSANIMTLAQRIFPDGYFSLTTALSMNSMIGTRPTRQVHIMTTRSKPKSFQLNLGSINMHVLSPNYFFGFTVSNGYKVASPEKAFIDSCYFYMHKVEYPFSLSSDVNVQDLNKDSLVEILKQYKNKKFVSFTLNMLEENGRNIR